MGTADDHQGERTNPPATPGSPHMRKLYRKGRRVKRVLRRAGKVCAFAFAAALAVITGG